MLKILGGSCLPAVCAGFLLLASCGKAPTPPHPVTLAISNESQAIAAASKYVPSAIVNKARMFAGEAQAGEGNVTRLVWDVGFADISVTRAELGWPPGSQTELGMEEPYTMIQVSLNAATGELIYREADILTVWSGSGRVYRASVRHAFRIEA